VKDIARKVKDIFDKKTYNILTSCTLTKEVKDVKDVF